MKYAPYSFSKINTYEQCALKFKFLYIDKLGTYVPNLAMERGSYIHTLLENDTKSKPTSFKFKIATPEQQSECIDIFIKFKQSELGQRYLEVPAQAEVEFGMKFVDGVLTPCSYYDKEALFRGKIDHSILEGETIHLIDWKTGKVSGFPAPLQLVMYAVWAFAMYPNVNFIRTAFVYVEHENQEKVYEFRREHLDALKKKVIEKIVNMEKEEKFRKSESRLCDYCDFRAAGLCEPETHDEFADKMMQYVKKDK